MSEIPVSPPAPPQDDGGILALAFALQLLGLPADPGQIRHAQGLAGPAGLDDLLRAARRFPVKARAIRSSLPRLEQTPLPAVAPLREGRFLLLLKAAEGKLLVLDPLAPRPRILAAGDFAADWNGQLLLLTRRAAPGMGGGGFTLGWFRAAIGKYRPILAEVLAASLFLQLFALVTPLFFQVVIDKVLVHRGLATLDMLMAGLALLSLFEVVLAGIRGYLSAHTANRIDVELGARLFGHLCALPLAYFRARRVGDSVARLRELETIRQFLTGSALTLVIDLAFATVFLAVMAGYSPPLTGITAAAFPFQIALGLWVVPPFRRRLDEKFRRGAENQAFLVETVSGMETVKALAAEPQMQRRWEEQLAAYAQAGFRAQSLANGATQASALINKLTQVALLFAGAHQVLAGRMSVGELVAFTMLAGNVSGPILRLAQLWQDFQQIRVSVARLADILDTPPEVPAAVRPVPLPPLRGAITFEQVSFRYRIDGPPALSAVSLSLAAGQMVGIVGPSGSGKSTLARLLQRLYLPESGRILVDGIDLATADAAWLRRQIGVVLQEDFLFNRTVFDNIALGDPATPLERVMEAARLAGAHDVIQQLPQGYHTPLGERGMVLSGGQRQRIAIARALLGDPRILILDEATSALDYESEAAIQANMRQIRAGRTVIVIAHRLSALRGADRIITLERGRVAEDGTHEELLRSGGRYAELHRLQSASC